MPYLNAATYKERKRQWQQRAAGLPPGPDRDACLALAVGYGNLIALLDSLNQGHAA